MSLSTIDSTGLTPGGVAQGSLGTNVAGNGPAFSAYLNTTQNVSNGVITKVVLNAENFDTANAFDSTTNYRFQPTVAGYYQLQGCVTNGSGAAVNGYTNGRIYKNGAAYSSTASQQPSNGNYASAYCSSLVYLNGSTDYVEFYTDHSGFTTNPIGLVAGEWTYFTGFLARAA